jgi:hypothetical protein
MSSAIMWKLAGTWAEISRRPFNRLPTCCVSGHLPL